MGIRSSLLPRRKGRCRESPHIPAVPMRRQLSWIDVSRMMWLLALSWQREGFGRGASLHWKWRLGNAAARAELRFGAERNQTQRSYYRVAQASVS